MIDEDAIAYSFLFELLVTFNSGFTLGQIFHAKMNCLFKNL